MNKISIILLFILFADCKAQQLNVCDKNSDWLKVLLVNKDKAAVFKFDFEKKQIVEFHHCYNCPDAIVSFYDCDGNKICDQGGFLGINTCPEFVQSNRTKLFP